MKMRTFIRKLFCALLFISSSLVFAESLPIDIKIDAGKTQSSGPLQQGFLHGLSNVNYDSKSVGLEKLNALKPTFWRIGLDYNFQNNYHLAKLLNPDIRITLSLSDLLAIKKGSYSHIRPWENWSAYEADIREIIGILSASDIRVDYWDVWSEPDTAAMWSGSCEQAMEMFHRTSMIIHTMIPDGKVVGPSVSAFDNKGSCKVSFLSQFLDYVTQHKLPIDAISWHELDTPVVVPRNVEAVRAYFKEHSKLPLPEIHINEYGGPADYESPGWAVGWLSSLEDAHVDWSSLACWGAGCQSGLNGLFQKDGRTPNPVYWVHEAYAKLPSNRMRVDLSEKSVAILAAKDVVSQSMTLILGRFESKVPAQSVRAINIDIENHFFNKLHVEISMQKISKPRFSWRAKKEASEFKQVRVPINNGRLIFSIPNVGDGDAWIIKLNAAN